MPDWSYFQNAPYFPQMAQAATPQAPTTWPTLDLSAPKYGEITNNQETGEMISPLEDAVDAHIAAKRMNKDDTFSVIDPSGSTVYYRYLGPNSGGRKDWMAIPKPSQDVPMS